MSLVLIVILDSLAIFLLNIPFGMWRTRVKKFSFEWFCSIHLPIPYIVVIRHITDIGFAWWSYPPFVAAFFLGQLYGKKLREKKKDD